VCDARAIFYIFLILMSPVSAGSTAILAILSFFVAVSPAAPFLIIPFYIFFTILFCASPFLAISLYILFFFVIFFYILSVVVAVTSRLPDGPAGSKKICLSESRALKTGFNCE
jgi:hypothetical protein